MSWIVGLRDDDIQVQSLYDEIDKLPLMNSVLPMTLMTGAYLAFVLKIGPAIMKNRKPLDLKNVIIAYNTFQVGLSLYMFVKSTTYLYVHGLVHSKCFVDHKDMRKETLYLIWMYFIAKITEFLDTVFFVLRKKSNQVSFLHVYHHTLMMVGSWLFLKFTPHDNVIFIGCANSLVHVFMYAYYALSAMPSLAKFLWWKKYITTLQLVQFVTVFFNYQVSLFYASCPPSKRLVFWVTVNNFLFMYLFTKFYIDNYKKNGGLEPKKEKDLTNGHARLLTKKVKAQ